MNSVAARQTPALVLVSDHRLRDEVHRIAAAADRHLDEPPTPIGRHHWVDAPVIVVDLTAARDCAAAGYPRRADTVLVTGDEPGLPEWQAAAALGTERVVALPAAAERLIAAFTDPVRHGPGNGLVLAVVGASGGAGASTLAAAVALTAATTDFRPDTLLVDGDPLGGGLDLLLGIESATGPRWPDLVIEDGRVAAAALHAALPSAAPRLAVLACGRVTAGAPPAEIGAGAVRAVLEAGRSAGDLVVCDVSGARGPHADHMLDTADLVVLTLPAQLRSVAAARAVLANIRRRNPNRGLIVRGPAPGGLRGPDMAEALGVPLLAAVRGEPGLAGRLERGGLTVPRGPLRTAAEAVLTALSEGIR
ncbi:septum site-determining protein Ssd [Nocardia terpenica]|uniref:Rv3660c-like CheY-like N-terminal domain-containing protein n=1 Tax=Nocardia terpenica TaxID=455432 RepID=A0A291RCJ0_9NOCA|nr:septum site-determining protein Ssd [Nocardia terpenica]ATL65286.1 hypothetical protein CRH09_02640 [Nocardia terpenica]